MACVNFCRNIVKYFCSFILGIFLLVGVPFLILCLTPFYLFRFLVSKSSRFFRPDLGKILHTRGATLSVDNIYSGIPKCNIFVAGVVDGTLDIQVFYDNIARVALEKNPDGSPTSPELQQYITSWMGYHFWKWDESFKIENHVRYYDGIYTEKLKKEGVNEDNMLILANEFIRTPFHPKRSPWEAFLVTDVRLKDGDPINKPKSFLVLRIHHSLADGFAVLKLITIDVMDAHYERAQTKYFQKSLMRKVFDGLSFVVRAPFEGACQIIEAIDFNQWHLAENQLSLDYNVAVTDRIPLEVIKEIKNYHDTSFTCILFAALAGGIRTFMINNGFKVPREMHCITPLPMPGHPAKLRNHLTLCVITLPVGLADPMDRIKAVAADLEKQRTSTVPISLFILGPLSGALPAWAIRATFRNYATTTVLTSMPGPDRVISFLGCPLDDVVFGGGMLAGNCGVGLSSLSYNGAIRIGAGVDKSIFSSRDKIKELVQNMVDELSVLKNLEV